MNLLDAAHGEEPLCKLPGRLHAALALTGRKTPAGGSKPSRDLRSWQSTWSQRPQHTGLLGVSEYGATVQMAMGEAVTILTWTMDSECVEA